MTRDEEQVVAQAVTRLRSALTPEKIVLFGSHAWGTPDAGSDVDLLVIVDKSDLPAYRRSRLAYRALRGLRFPKDILVLTRAEFERQRSVECSLARRIHEQGTVLYDRRQAAGSGAVAAQEPA